VSKTGKRKQEKKLTEPEKGEKELRGAKEKSLK
jgi:hypothetical protein